MSMAGGIGLAVSLLLFLAILFGGLMIILGSIARRKEADARKRYPQALRVDRTANFFGQESHGFTQMRGNGTLILTESDLIFERWLPARKYRVSIPSIISLEKPRAFLGKSRFSPLLKVVFRDEGGNTDAMAWRVRDLPGWMQQIKDAMR